MSFKSNLNVTLIYSITVVSNSYKRNTTIFYFN